MHAGRCDLKPACDGGGSTGWVASRRPWRGGSTQREDAGVAEETEQADEEDDTGSHSRRAHAPARRATRPGGSLVALTRYRPGWNLSWLIVQTRQGGLVAPHRPLPPDVNAPRPWRGGVRTPAFRIMEEESIGKCVSPLGPCGDSPPTRLVSAHEGACWRVGPRRWPHHRGLSGPRGGLTATRAAVSAPAPVHAHMEADSRPLAGVGWVV